jgi:hypothetical protein
MGKPAWVRLLLIAIIFAGAAFPTNESSAQRLQCQSGGEGATACSHYTLVYQCQTSCPKGSGTYACCTIGGNCTCREYDKKAKK